MFYRSSIKKPQSIDLQRSIVKILGACKAYLMVCHPSVLVLGLSLEAAKTLGGRFEQNTVVWTWRNGVPELMLLNH